jgi:serine protease Do
MKRIRLRSRSAARLRVAATDSVQATTGSGCWPRESGSGAGVMHSRYGRAAFFVFPVLLILGLSLPLLLGAHFDRADSLRLREAGRAKQVVRAAASDTIDNDRRTAIVRASEAIAPSVVSVNVLRRETVRAQSLWEQLFVGPGVSRETQGLGSGFIIDARGYVLSNEHVVRGATEVTVTLADGRDFKADIVGTDDVTDLALLRLVDPRPADLPVATLGTSQDLVTGEWVIAIGNPFGFLLSNPEPTVTAGVVSGVGRNIIPGDGERGYYLDMIQTDASINPGNSGGALVNALGQVVGVNSSIISETGSNVGLGFAIPIDRAKRVADALMREGSVRRAWVGMTVKPSAPNRFGRSQRVEVASVVTNSPAARAGFRAGTVIDSAGGHAIHNQLDWDARLLDLRVGETLDVVASPQNGGRRAMRLSTQDLPSFNAERVRASRDFEFITVTPAIQAERGLANSEGALISQLSDAAKSLGLQEGDLVLQINQVRIRNAQDAASLLRRMSTRSGTVRMVFERQGQLNQVAFTIGG